MSDMKLLESFSISELRQELRAREGLKRSELPAHVFGERSMPLEGELGVSERLRSFEDETIFQRMMGMEKAIYGTDDREDIYELPDGDYRKTVADSVVALCKSSIVEDNGDGTSTLVTRNFGESYRICPRVPFTQQPTAGGICTGFLVTSDIIATAGHCVTADNVTDKLVVFGFEMTDALTARVVIDNHEIYRGREVICREKVGDGPDWALIRLDRPVTNHRALEIRRHGKVNDRQAVYAIGHPSGLPKKISAGAETIVRENSDPRIFKVNTDTFVGNSGSPVLNAMDNTVEGILVRGESDFVLVGECFKPRVCPADDCRGEDCTRTTRFASRIP